MSPTGKVTYISLSADDPALDAAFASAIADVRAALDGFFIAGVNHIVYHGTAYSPPGDPWPGWQFYASVEFNSRNSWCCPARA